MSSNWLEIQRAQYTKAREHFYELLESHKKNGTSAIASFTQNHQELIKKEQDLRDKITQATDPKEKVILNYQLLSTINLQRENNEILALLNNNKTNFSAEKTYFASVADHLDAKMHTLQRALIDRSRHMALLEIEPPHLSVQKVNIQELHDVHVSMHELIHAKSPREYEEISAAMNQQSQDDYNVFHQFALHAHMAIQASDDRKAESAKQTDKPVKVIAPIGIAKSTFENNQNYFFAKKKSNVVRAQENPTLQEAELQALALLKEDKENLESRKIKIHQELSDLKTQRAAGKFDEKRYHHLQYENQLIERALDKYKSTQEIVNSNKMSADYVKDKPQVKTKEKNVGLSARNSMNR